MLASKEWDYYYIGNQDYGITLTVADNGYMWILSATLLDFKSKKSIPKTKNGYLPFKRFLCLKRVMKAIFMLKKEIGEISFKHENQIRHIK